MGQENEDVEQSLNGFQAQTHRFPDEAYKIVV